MEASKDLKFFAGSHSHCFPAEISVVATGIFKATSDQLSITGMFPINFLDQAESSQK